MQPEIAIGSCDGTGAAIYVCCGFKPRRVEVRNLEDAGAKAPVLIFQEGMELVAAMDEGMKLTGLDDTDMDRTALAAAGISMYDGGDEIHWDATSARWEDRDGNDVSEKFVDAYFKKAAAGAAYKCIGDTLDPVRSGGYFKTPVGFIIGTDADINADGEQLIWIAYR
jgi:hypothetical protein